MTTHDIPYSAVPPCPPPQPPTPPPISLPHLILLCVVTVALFPSFLLMRIVGLTSPVDSISDFIASNFNGPNPVESQYRLQFTLESSAQRHLQAALAAVASLLATLLVPALRNSAFLGSPLYNWSLLAIVLFCGNYLADATVRATVTALGPRFRQNKRWCYYANGTLINPLGSALHSTLILLTWRFLQFSTVNHPVTRYGAWVLGAWMTRCTMLLLNSAIMARWRANALFDRYEERILRVGFQFHIMYALIPSAGKDLSFMAPWRKKDGEVEIVQVAGDGSVVEMCCKVEDHIRYLSRRKPTKQEVALVGMHIQGLTTLLPPELGDTLADTARHEQGISPDDGGQIDKIWVKDRFKLCNEDARILYGELCALVTSPDQVSFHTFATWMSGAYNDNLALGQTLREGDNAIINSDRLLMALMINKALLLWLFFTGKTTTQVLSVIPFVYFAKCFVEEMFKPQFRMLIG